MISPGDIAAALFCIAFFGGSGLLLLLAWHDQRRRGLGPEPPDIEAVAAELGFEMLDRFPAEVREAALPLIRSAGRRAGRCWFGAMDGTEVWLFEWSASATAEYATRIAAAVVRIDADCPPLRIERDDVRSVARQAVAARLPVELEWERFNRHFDVRAPDTEFARMFLDGAMMEHLMAVEGWPTFEVGGRFVLARTWLVRADEVARLPRLAVDLSRQVPAAVLRRYAPERSLRRRSSTDERPSSRLA